MGRPCNTLRLPAFALFCILATATALELIGEHDEKFYWVEKTPTNFSNAASYCTMFGWELITLDSQQEFDYVKSAVSNHTNDNAYWTTAVQSSAHRWGYGNGTILDPFIYPVTMEFRTCVVFMGPELFAHPCEGAPGLNYYPLCQMRNAKEAF